ncbi:MAG: hypothetical protein HQ564_01755 [Candidatus Saganbacteria bacterium]|nr:hypothetical protein [Candidatus Saganbacteria bacterium]
MGTENGIKTQIGMICMPKPNAKAWPKGRINKRQAKRLKARQQCLRFEIDSKTGKFSKPKLIEPKPIIKKSKKTGPLTRTSYSVDNNIPTYTKHWVRIATKGTLHTFGSKLVRFPTFYEISPFPDKKEALETQTTKDTTKGTSKKVRTHKGNLYGIELFKYTKVKDLDSEKADPTDLNSKEGSKISPLENEAIALATKMFDEAGSSQKNLIWKGKVLNYLTQVSAKAIEDKTEAPALK